MQLQTSSKGPGERAKGHEVSHFPVPLAVFSWTLPATSWVDKVTTYLQNLGKLREIAEDRRAWRAAVLASVTHTQPGISQKQKLKDEELTRGPPP